MTVFKQRRTNLWCGKNNREKGGKEVGIVQHNLPEWLPLEPMSRPVIVEVFDQQSIQILFETNNFILLKLIPDLLNVSNLLPTNRLQVLVQLFVVQVAGRKVGCGIPNEKCIQIADEKRSFPVVSSL